MKDEGSKSEKETIVTTAEYRGFFIRYTSLDRLLVTIYTNTYPVTDLKAAKKMIDEYKAMKK